MSLAQSEAQRNTALMWLLTALPTAAGYAALRLAEAVVSLAQSEAQRGEALAGLLAALPTADLSAAAGLARAVMPQDRRGSSR